MLQGVAIARTPVVFGVVITDHSGTSVAATALERDAPVELRPEADAQQGSNGNLPMGRGVEGSYRLLIAGGAV